MKVPVKLDQSEWSQVIDAMTYAPWRNVNPLLLKISAQMNAAMEPTEPRAAFNSGDVRKPPVPPKHVT